MLQLRGRRVGCPWPALASHWVESARARGRDKRPSFWCAMTARTYQQELPPRAPLPPDTVATLILNLSAATIPRAAVSVRRSFAVLGSGCATLKPGRPEAWDLTAAAKAAGDQGV